MLALLPSTELGVLPTCKHLGIALYPRSLFLHFILLLKERILKHVLIWCQYVCVSIVADSYMPCFTTNMAIVGCFNISCSFFIKTFYTIAYGKSLEPSALLKAAHAISAKSCNDFVAADVQCSVLLLVYS